MQWDLLDVQAFYAFQFADLCAVARDQADFRNISVALRLAAAWAADAEYLLIISLKAD